VTWSAGDTIVFRQVWQGKPPFAFPCVVVSDEPGLLVTRAGRLISGRLSP
jgi:hypothetical protein